MTGWRPSAALCDFLERTGRLRHEEIVLGFKLPRPGLPPNPIRGRNRWRPIVVGRLRHRSANVEGIQELKVLHLGQSPAAETNARTPCTSQTIALDRFSSIWPRRIQTRGCHR